jgi:hypothetical protein
MNTRILAFPLVLWLLPYLASASSELFIPGFNDTDLAVFHDASPLEVELKKMRRDLVSDDVNKQCQAAEFLLNAKDKETIKRLVYALRQGYSKAGTLLDRQPLIETVPYLVEDMAHGDFESLGGSDWEKGSVRGWAISIVIECLYVTKGFPDETAAWFNYLRDQRGRGFLVLPDMARLLSEWWEHNENAVLSGNLKAASWLARDRMVVLATDPYTPNEPPPPPPTKIAPPKSLPLYLPENFESWNTRMDKRGGRQLTFKPLILFEPRSPVDPSTKLTQDKLSIVNFSWSGTGWFTACIGVVLAAVLVRLKIRSVKR